MDLNKLNGIKLGLYTTLIVICVILAATKAYFTLADSSVPKEITEQDSKDIILNLAQFGFRYKLKESDSKYVIDYLYTFLPELVTAVFAIFQLLLGFYIKNTCQG